MCCLFFGGCGNRAIISIIGFKMSNQTPNIGVNSGNQAAPYNALSMVLVLDTGCKLPVGICRYHTAQASGGASTNWGAGASWFLGTPHPKHLGVH